MLVYLMTGSFCNVTVYEERPCVLKRMDGKVGITNSFLSIFSMALNVEYEDYRSLCLLLLFHTVLLAHQVFRSCKSGIPLWCVYEYC